MFPRRPGEWRTHETNDGNIARVVNRQRALTAGPRGFLRDADFCPPYKGRGCKRLGLL